MNTEQIKEVLLKEVVPSNGCTEVSSLAYLVALAKEQAKSINKIKIVMSTDVLKNAASVGIPGGGRGIETIVRKALLSKPNELNTLSTSTGLYEGTLNIELEAMTINTLFVGVQIDDGKLYALVNSYSNLVIYDDFESAIKDLESCSSSGYYYGISKLSIEEILNHAKELVKDDEVKRLIEDAKKLNLRLSKCEPRSLVYGDEPEWIRKTVSAIDARMSGARCPAMSVAGSGNQGIFTTIPLVMIAKDNNIPEERLDVALVFAWLMTIYSTEIIGRVVSEYCGLLHKAGVGLVCGLSYLLGRDNIEARANELFSVSGVFCDGAKPSCGKKARYILSVIFSIVNKEKVVTRAEGVVGPTLKDTLENIKKLLNPEQSRKVCEIMVSN